MSTSRACCCDASVNVCTKGIIGKTSDPDDWCCRTGEEKVVLKVERNAFTLSSSTPCGEAPEDPCVPDPYQCTSRRVCPGDAPLINIYDCIGQKTFVDRSYSTWLPPRCDQAGQLGGVFAGVWKGKCYTVAPTNAKCCEGAFTGSDPPTPFDYTYTEDAGSSSCSATCQLGYLDFYRQIASNASLGQQLARPLSPGQKVKSDDDTPEHDWALDIVSWDPNDNGASESPSWIYRSRIFKHYDKDGAEITGTTGLKKHWLCETLVAMVHCEVWFQSSECSDVPAPPGDVTNWGCRVPKWVIQGFSGKPVFSWALWQNTSLTSTEKSDIASHIYPDGTNYESPMSDSLAAKLASSGVVEMGDFHDTFSSPPNKPVKVKIPETIYEPVDDATETSVDAGDVFGSTTHFYFWGKPGGWTWACSGAGGTGTIDKLPQIPRRYSPTCDVAALFPGDSPLGTGGDSMGHNRSDCFTAAPIPQSGCATSSNFGDCDPPIFPLFLTCDPSIGDICSADWAKPSCDGLHVTWVGYNAAANGLASTEFADCTTSNHAYFFVMDDLAETETSAGGISSCSPLSDPVANTEIETETRHYPPVGLTIAHGSGTGNFCACANALNTHSGPSTSPSANFRPCDSPPSVYSACQEEHSITCVDKDRIGEWMADEDSYPCSLKRGACCIALSGDCHDGLTKAQCANLGGTWYEDTDCGEGPPYALC